MAVIPPPDNKTACHKSPLKTEAVRLLFALSIRACAVCVHTELSLFAAFFFIRLKLII